METLVRLDGRELTIPPEIITLEGILEHVLSNELDSEREVVEVKLDGNTFSEEFPHEAMLMERDEFKVVDILTETKGNLAEMALEQLPYFISTIRKGFRTAANVLRDTYSENEGHRLVAVSAESLGALINHLHVIILSLKNGKRGELTSVYSNLTEGLADLLEEIIATQQEKDPILLADLLEFEIIPILEKLGTGVEKLLN